MPGKVLVLGARGRFGRHAVDEFAAAGWTVRTFDRTRDDLDRAAADVDVIANGWNPPYPDWAAQLPILHAAVRKAALASGATVLIPGNVYVFGPEAPGPWSEVTPHRAANPLGRLRLEMEDAYRSDGVQTIVLRAGDFLDTVASGNWFDRILAPRLKDGVLTYPGRTNVPHAWAYLPDLARAAVALAERRDGLPTFADIPFPGFTLTGDDLAAGLSHVMGRAITVRPFAWWPLRITAPVWPMGRCLVEMRYLWDTPHRLDGAAFERHVPDFVQTPLDAALRAAIRPILGGDQIDPDEPVAAGH